MNKVEIYNDLMRQYNLLTSKEKNSITIYKSKLFFHINSLSSIDKLMDLSSIEIINKLDNREEFIRKYIEYKQIVDDPKNMFLKFSVFKNIDFTDIESFTDSIKKVYIDLDSIRNKMILAEKLLVYRGCSYSDEEYDISKGNLISTSINSDVVDDFLFTNKKNKIYKIFLKKGTPVMVTPYSIVNSYDNEVNSIMGLNSRQLKVVKGNNNSQMEIVLYKDMLDFYLIENKVVDDISIDIMIVDVKENQNKKERGI